MVKQRIHESNNSNDRMLFGIFYEGLHIGNLTFYMIDERHKCLRIGIAIGQKNLHRQGFDSEALRAALKHVLNVLKFNQIEACPYSNNNAFVKLFKSIDFIKEVTLKERLLHRGDYTEMILYRYLKSDHK